MKSLCSERDLCPEDLLTVAKNCLDLLMRPDKELSPGRVTGAPRLRRAGKTGVKKWVCFRWRCCSAGWRHLLISVCGGARSVSLSGIHTSGFAFRSVCRCRGRFKGF